MELKKLGVLIARNNKLYFKDKLQFFASLLTPIILIVLFLTFFGNIYKTSFLAFVPENIQIEDSLVSVFTSSWLFSSILATSCITVAFCSNIMTNDKITKVYLDFKITPVKKTTLQISYFISNFITAFLVCFTVFIISLIYFAIIGFYLSFVDILLILVNIVLSILMGSLAASIVWFFASSQGAQNAICTLISSMYGFLCGAYMPISQFSQTIQHFVGFIPGTYSTVIFRNYYMRGILQHLSNDLPEQAIDGIKVAFDSNFKFFDTQVSILAMFLVVIFSIFVLLGIYLLIIFIKNKKFHSKLKIKTSNKI